jgi:hypothetical protein
MKIQLKTKVFIWYLRHGVILTKDNLAKHNWQDSKKFVIWHHDETIKQLFFECHFARSIWSIIQLGSTLYPPRRNASIFGYWLNGVDLRFKLLIRVGALAIIWSLWMCKNDNVFNDKTIILLCSLPTGAVVCSVHGRIFSVLRTATSLRRCLHG